MSETQLFESKICSGYFGIKRFDRQNGGKIHMVSVSGLLETSHRLPNIDYNILMKLTLELTKNYQDIEQLYRLMCFNVFAHNRDDHSKNFSFLYDENKKEWRKLVMRGIKTDNSWSNSADKYIALYNDTIHLF